MLKKYPCYKVSKSLYYCDTLIGEAYYKTPSDDWTCPECTNINHVGILTCQKCDLMWSGNSEYRRRNKRIRVYPTTKYLIFVKDNNNYHLQLEYRKLTVTFDDSDQCELSRYFDLIITVTNLEFKITSVNQ